jgi:hypothetical protein
MLIDGSRLKTSGASPRLSFCEGLAVGRKANEELRESAMGEVNARDGGTGFGRPDVAENRRRLQQFVDPVAGAEPNLGLSARFRGQCRDQAGKDDEGWPHAGAEHPRRADEKGFEGFHQLCLAQPVWMFQLLNVGDMLKFDSSIRMRDWQNCHGSR